MKSELVNTDRPWTVWTPGNEDAIIAAVEKFLWYPTRTGTVPTECSQSCSWWSVASILLLVEHTFVSRWSSPTHAVLWTAMISIHCIWALFYATFCGQMKCVLCVRVCSMSITVSSGHRTILMLSVNVGIKSTSVLVFGLVSSETLSWAPICYLTGWQCPKILIFFNCSSGPEDVPLVRVSCVMLNAKCIQHNRVSAHYGEYVQKWFECDIPRRWIGLWGLIVWLPRLLDVIPKIYPVGTPEGTRLHRPSQDYQRSRGKIPSSCDSFQYQHLKAY